MHESVVLRSKTAATAFSVVRSEGEASQIDEAPKGVTNVGETRDMPPGSLTMLTLTLAPGH